MNGIILLCSRNTCTSPGIGMLWTEWGATVAYLLATVMKNLNRKFCLIAQERCRPSHRWVSRLKYDFMYSIIKTFWQFYTHSAKLSVHPLDWKQWCGSVQRLGWPVWNCHSSTCAEGTIKKTVWQFYLHSAKLVVLPTHWTEKSGVELKCSTTGMTCVKLSCAWMEQWSKLCACVCVLEMLASHECSCCLAPVQFKFK